MEKQRLLGVMLRLLRVCSLPSGIVHEKTAPNAAIFNVLAKTWLRQHCVASQDCAQLPGWVHAHALISGAGILAPLPS